MLISESLQVDDQVTNDCRWCYVIYHKTSADFTLIIIIIIIIIKFSLCIGFDDNSWLRVAADRRIEHWSVIQLMGVGANRSSVDWKARGLRRRRWVAAGNGMV